MAATVSVLREPPRSNGWYCPTPTGQAMHGLLRQCLADGQLGLLIGHPGCGKTAALTAFAEANPGVVHVRASTVLNRPQQLLVQFCKRAQCEVYYSTMAAGELMEELRNAVSWQRYRMLTIDEGQYLQDAALHLVRDIHDELRIGIVLAGNRELLNRLNRPPRGNSSGFAHFMGRIGPMQEYDGAEPEDIQALAGHHPLTADAKPIFVQVAQRFGLHRASNLIHMARQCAESPELDAGHLEDAAMALNIGLRK